MSDMTDYLEVEIRKHIFRTGSFTKPTVLAEALFTAAPGESGGGTEVTGGSYARAQLDPLDANWTGASSTDGLTDNAGDLSFPSPTANWGLVTHKALFDATTSGNMLFHGALTASKTINSGDPAPKYAAGDSDYTLA